MSKVSIIIPVYNVATFLRKALDSVIKQTLEDIEIICVDDCSTDNSFEILQEYAQKDSRVKIIKQEKNQGEVVAKYTGAQLAQSDYIGTLDPDDYYSTNFCEILYKQLSTNNADMACCNMQHIKENGSLLKNKIIQIGKKHSCVSLNSSFINSINPSTTNKIMKKDIYINALNFTERDIWKDFYQYWRGYSKESYKICLIPEELYFYRKRKNSIIHTKINYQTKWNSLLKTIDLILNYLLKNNRYEIYKKAFWETAAVKIKKVQKGHFNYSRAISEIEEIAGKYNIPITDLQILNTNKLKIFLIGR